MSNDWQDIYTGNEKEVQQAAEELKRKMSGKDKQYWHDIFVGNNDDPSIADQLRARIREIGINQIDYLEEPTGCDPKEIYKSWEQHYPEILWANKPLPELNGMTPNQVIELTNQLDKILSLRSCNNK